MSKYWSPVSRLLHKTFMSDEIKPTDEAKLDTDAFADQDKDVRLDLDKPADDVVAPAEPEVTPEDETPVDDIEEDIDTAEFNCDACGGSGLKDQQTVCPVCNGTGKV